MVIASGHRFDNLRRSTGQLDGALQSFFIEVVPTFDPGAWVNREFSCGDTQNHPQRLPKSGYLTTSASGTSIPAQPTSRSCIHTARTWRYKNSKTLGWVIIDRKKRGIDSNPQ